MGEYEKKIAEREAHKNRMEEKYGTKGHRNAGMLYELAVEYGHAGGFSEIEIYYSELSALLKENK